MPIADKKEALSYYRDRNARTIYILMDDPKDKEKLALAAAGMGLDIMSWYRHYLYNQTMEMADKHIKNPLIKGARVKRGKAGRD